MIRAILCLLLLLSGVASAQPTNTLGLSVTVPTATTGALGLVRPDGTTITISGGVISAAGGGGAGPATVSPTPAASVPALSTIKVLLADGTYLTGTQLQAVLGTAPVTATGATLAGVPTTGTTGTAITGITTTLTPSGATAYASLTIAGTEQTPRAGFTGTSVPSLTPASAGATTVSIYAAASGGSALVTSASFTVSAPVAVPGQVTGLTVGTPTTTTLPLTWTAPSTGATVAGYSVTRTPAGGSPTTVATGSTTPSFTLTGLTAGTVYSITVAATNASGGAGAASAAASGTTAAGSFVTYTVVPGNYPPVTTANSGGTAGNYLGAAGQIRITGSDSSYPTDTGLIGVWTKSSSVKPTSTGNSSTVTVDSQYGTHAYESAAFTAVGGYPGLYGSSSHYIWTHSVPAGNYYLWVYVTGSDGHADWYCMTSAPVVVS